MTGLHCKLVLTCSILLSALVLLASGCTSTVRDLKAGDIDEIPLLVKFSAAGCPVDVLQVVESCESLPPGVLVGKDLACRNKGKRIVWFAVTGDSLPYHVGYALPKFEITFKDPADDPIEKADRGGRCKESTSGVLDCKIRNNAPQKTYGYSVVVAACPVLDPRIYVP